MFGNTEENKSNFFRNYYPQIILFSINTVALIILLICTEIIFDSSILLNTGLLVFTVVLSFLPLLTAFIDENSVFFRRFAYLVILVIHFILIILLIYRRNRIIRIIIHDDYLSDGDYSVLANLFAKPSSIIIMYGYDVKYVLAVLESMYPHVRYHLLDNPSDYKINQFRDLDTNSSRNRLSGIAWSGVFLSYEFPDENFLSRTLYRVFPMTGEDYGRWEF